MSTIVTDRPDLKNKVRDSQGGGVGGGNQVVLFNDDINPFDYVVHCLMNVFQHPEGVALKITEEAHHKGRAIAEVEEADKAREHVQQLFGMGLMASVESF